MAYANANDRYRPVINRVLLGVSIVVGIGGCRRPMSSGPRPPQAERVPVAALSVPAAPIAVRAAGHTALVYELHVTNVGTRPLSIERLEVHGEAIGPVGPLAVYDRRQIQRDVKFLAPRGAPIPKTLTPGARAIVYVWLSLDTTAAVPRELSHRVIFSGADTADGGTTPVRGPTDLVLAPPVGPGDWWFGLGPSNSSEHRRAVVRVGDDTVPHLAQRFAIDWVKMDARGEYARDHEGRRNTDWYGYGEPVYAAADARVAAVVDSIPDNVPGENSRAVAMTVGTVLGNYVVLDLGPGDRAVHRYALYGHLEPGTVKVHAGDVVHRGQELGSIGNSGNSDGPHLHFHITEAADAAAAPLRSEGVPFVLAEFTVVGHDPELVAKHASLTPLGGHRNALAVEGDVIRIADGRR